VLRGTHGPDDPRVRTAKARRLGVLNDPAE
jgi:hypothetical protein